MFWYFSDIEKSGDRGLYYKGLLSGRGACVIAEKDNWAIRNCALSEVPGLRSINRRDKAGIKKGIKRV